MTHLGKAARRTLVEYFKKTSLNGFGLLYHIRRRRFQRLFWFMFIALGILFASYVVLHTLFEFLVHPTVTVLSAQGLDIAVTPFPALAVCSANKLSKQALHQYAQQLTKNGMSAQDWLRQLHLLGGYFQPGSVPAENASALQALFGDRWPKDGARGQLLSLAPSCRTQLLRCEVAGVAHSCDDLFQLVGTGNGCCCVFNQDGLSDGNDSYRHVASGQEMGLTLLLNGSRADDFPMVRTQRSDGYSIHVFASDGFMPEAGTGAQRTLHIARAGETVAVELHVVAQQAESRLLDYDVSRRGCLFASDGVSLSKCLSQCRLHSIVSKCSCLPFPHSQSREWNVSQCTLSDTACLQTHESIWSPAMPECSRCLPLCNDYRYELHKGNPTNMRRNPDGHSRLTLYYRAMRMPLYSQSELYNWYQILSNIGGVIGICIGCSLISGVEIIYFIIFRLFENFLHLRNGDM